jgi:putative (di)nucleoside polyphosphate hydrolase
VVPLHHQNPSPCSLARCFGPQGGIDPEEDPREAALRELYEETGIQRCRIVASIVRWLQYSFPTKVKAQLPGSFLRYRGQAQVRF